MKKKTLKQSLLTASILSVVGTGVVVPMASQPYSVYAEKTTNSPQTALYQKYKMKIGAVKEVNRLETTLKLESEIKTMNESKEKNILLQSIDEVKTRQLLELARSIKEKTPLYLVSTFSTETSDSRIKDLLDLSNSTMSNNTSAIIKQDRKKMEENISLARFDEKAKQYSLKNKMSTFYESSLVKDVSKMNTDYQSRVKYVVNQKKEQGLRLQHADFQKIYMHLLDKDSLNEMMKIENATGNKNDKNFMISERLKLQKKYPLANTSTDYSNKNDESGDYKRFKKLVLSLDSLNLQSDVFVYKPFIESKLNKIQQTKNQNPAFFKDTLSKQMDKQVYQQVYKELDFFKETNDERDLTKLKEHISQFNDSSLRMMMMNRLNESIEVNKAKEISFLIKYMPELSNKYLLQIKTKLDALLPSKEKDVLQDRYNKKYNEYLELNARTSILIVKKTLDKDDYNIAVLDVSKIQNESIKKSSTEELEKIKKMITVNKTNTLKK